MTPHDARHDSAASEAQVMAFWGDPKQVRARFGRSNQSAPVMINEPKELDLVSVRDRNGKVVLWSKKRSQVVGRQG